MRFLVVLLSSLLVAPPVFATPDGTAPKLAGTWRFVSEVDRRADGSLVTAGPKEGYEGLLIYTAGGQVSVQLMPRGRVWNPSTASLEQLRETAEAGTAYFGRYTVDPGAGIVVHTVAGSLDPSFEGQALTRRFRLDGDTLVLSGTWEEGGETLTFEITWKRLE